ncbi:hypothetical protein F925_00591 [Acinetobacter lwoffii NCTC 5866 = CIP 64.10 = NIPH 512]|nr:hypothetical protein F925_00591 [Acinetobacter lwoffii NCTC 5866 = CIP 64.10 = NIPH 512]
MAKLVWIHKFNNNELGISESGGTGRGAFCLVPAEAREIFPPLFESNFFKQQVKLFVNRNFRATVNFGKPPSKSEYRLSLPKEIHTDEQGNILIAPSSVVAIYQYEDGVNIDVNSNKLDLSDFLERYRQSKGSNNKVIKLISEEGLSLDSVVHEQGITRLSKPFLLLAGISGTGKTRFVREQAKASGNLSETYCLTSVRPDWHEPSDLLGYVSRLSGKTEYITTDVLNFIAKAWKALIDSGLELRVDNIEGYGERLYVCGNILQLDQIPPFWLCLDEMNLAPVEQYFADYLSVLETREWHWNGETFKYLTDALLKPTIFKQIENGTEFRQDLGFEGSQYDAAWDVFSKFGLGIPFNLLVAGTVNMDETTHGFSRKVIDRALSFDFGEFFPNIFHEYFQSNIKNRTLSYPIRSYVNLSALPEIDKNGTRTITFLDAVNKLLDNTPFKLAYRALNELMLAVVTQNPKSDIDLLAVWDDFLMCKVLPRIEGDSDKLVNTHSEDSILKQLVILIEHEFLKFEDSFASGTQNINRPDLLREFREGKSDIYIPCRSLVKLKWMQTRLENSGFTSFWP